MRDGSCRNLSRRSMSTQRRASHTRANAEPAALVPAAPRVYASAMSDDAPSFVRGIFAGAIHDDLLFPFPASLGARDPDEARTVRRLLADLERLRDSGIIDPARFDEEETV